jgi:hypothetical protein
MREWNPFATEHEHVECCAKRIAEEMGEVVRKMLNKK